MLGRCSARLWMRQLLCIGILYMPCRRTVDLPYSKPSTSGISGTCLAVCVWLSMVTRLNCGLGGHGWFSCSLLHARAILVTAWGRYPTLLEDERMNADLMVRDKHRDHVRLQPQRGCQVQGQHVCNRRIRMTVESPITCRCLSRSGAFDCAE